MPRTTREKECVSDMRLELVPLPSTDVDRRKAFYVDRVGFNVDHDVARRTLTGNGIDVSDVNDMGGGIRYAYFSDPDGNSWALQISR